MLEIDRMKKQILKRQKIKQLELFNEKVISEFGGELLRGKRKSQRPLSTRRPIHLVLRGDIRRSGSLRRHQSFVEKTIKKFATQFRLKIYKLAVNSNHCHALIKISQREDYKNFVRAVAGALAKKTKIKWVVRPFTRLVGWGRDFTNACAYILKNELEAAGVIAYTPRKIKKLKPRDSS